MPGPAAADASTIRSRRTSRSSSRSRRPRISAICRRRGWSTGTSTCSGRLGVARAIEVAYVGSRGHDLISARDINQPAASPIPPNLRPNPLFADITLIESRASSQIQRAADQVPAARRARPVAARELHARQVDRRCVGVLHERGRSELPAGQPRSRRGARPLELRRAPPASRSSVGATSCRCHGNAAGLSDWELQGIVTLQSGRPFTVAVHPDIDTSNTGRSNLGFGYNDRPNVTGDPSARRIRPRSGGSTPPRSRCRRSAPSATPAATSSTARAIRTSTWRCSSTCRSATTLRLQLRVETFNLFNRTNFDLPDAFLGSPTFGQILSRRSPRRIQFGVRAMF